MRIVVDYRPALRARTGVGEYLHQAVRALGASPDDGEITLFSSSWADRVDPAASAELSRARVIDRKVPVSVLNFCWHRLEWPPIETLTGGRFDVAHSPHPLLLPARDAAQVVTIHDLHFLSHPERTTREIRRDYPSLVKSHAARAHRIIVSSQFAAGEVRSRLDVPADRIALCPAGTPEWAQQVKGGDPAGYLLFMGTIDARKNISGLLEAYKHLAADVPSPPRLTIAGAASADAGSVLAALKTPPLAGRVEHLGYVSDAQREALFRGARIFVLPSLEEGFGLPVLEAMAAGVPVVASNRGSLPEVVGDAGLLIDPTDTVALTNAIRRLLDDRALWQNLRVRGLDRARQFTWAQTARDIRRAYDGALATRHQQMAHAHRN